MTPNFAATPRCGVGTISVAETSRTAPASFTNIFAAGANGSRIDEVNIVATGSTTAGVVRLFVFNGSNYFLLQEVLVTGITPSATIASFNSVVTYNNLMLPSGSSLVATTNNAEPFAITAFGGDF